MHVKRTLLELFPRAIGPRKKDTTVHQPRTVNTISLGNSGRIKLINSVLWKNNKKRVRVNTQNCIFTLAPFYQICTRSSGGR